MKIYYISDLHLDYKTLEEKNEFLSLLNKEDLFIINGDFYNDYRKTIDIVNEIDKMGVKGYWTLGNHEFFWLAERRNIEPLDKAKNKDLLNVPPAKMWDKLVDTIKAKTAKNKTFKFLETGTTVKLPNGWTLIGDIGWTSFSTENYELKNKDFKQYEWFKRWNFPWIKTQNEKWVKFANATIKKHDKVLIATHYPMYYNDKFPETSRFSSKLPLEKTYWFSSQKLEIPKGKEVVFIHGHTHDVSYKEGHVTNAIGRQGNAKKLELKEIILK
ncbi:MAG: metallophosphoesterase [Mycoplasmataceae bacterium]|nr:metallophosphoesterase [Mycoplasmataceae bacterium]